MDHHPLTPSRDSSSGLLVMRGTLVNGCPAWEEEVKCTVLE